MSPAPEPHFILSFSCNAEFTEQHPALNFTGYPSCKFSPGKVNPFHLPPQTIQVNEILHCSENSTIYCGLCTDGREVILKFTAAQDDIFQEATAYDNLKSIQGTVLPYFYGVLCGRDTHRKLVFCLVFQRFGDRLQCSFSSLKPMQK